MEIRTVHDSSIFTALIRRAVKRAVRSGRLLVHDVMRRKTGTSGPSALPVQSMAAKNILSTNFFLYFWATSSVLFKGLFDIFDPKLNTILFLSVGI